MAGTEKIIKNVTGGFLIVGFFIPGFTLMGLLGLQMLICSLGVECANAWRVLWVATSISCVAWPILYGMFIWKYYNTLATYNSRLKFKFGIVLFNIFELLFIQLTLGMFFTTGKTLCYATDGQNGLELLFSGWLALPPLYILGLVFHKFLNKLIVNGERLQAN